MQCSSLSEHQPMKCFCQCALPLCMIWRSRTATQMYPQLCGGLKRIAPRYAACVCLHGAALPALCSLLQMKLELAQTESHCYITMLLKYTFCICSRRTAVQRHKVPCTHSTHQEQDSVMASHAAHVLKFLFPPQVFTQDNLHHKGQLFGLLLNAEGPYCLLTQTFLFCSCSLCRP